MKKKYPNRSEKHLKYVKLLNSKEWRELRAWKIQSCQGLCERCKQEGIAAGVPGGYIRAANTVHHRIPVESGKTDEEMRALCFNPHNLILLCPDCHHRTHEEMKSHRWQTVRTMPKDTVEGEQRQQMEAFADRLGGKYEPTKKGIRKTRFGWVTKEEYMQKSAEQFNKWKDKINGHTNVEATPTVDTDTEDRPFTGSN